MTMQLAIRGIVSSRKVWLNLGEYAIPKINGSCAPRQNPKQIPCGGSVPIKCVNSCVIMPKNIDATMTSAIVKIQNRVSLIFSPFSFVLSLSLCISGIRPKCAVLLSVL